MLQRMHGLVITVLLWGASASACADGAAGSFDPSKLKGPAKGSANEVLVLGTAHLAQLPANFQPAALTLLKERVFDWKPQIIAIEKLSGPQCAFMRQYPLRYKRTVQNYCWDPAPARAATGLDVPEASVEISRLLANWPTAPTSSQRRRLAAVFLAGGEPTSALVQWLRLPVSERRTGDGLDPNLVLTLEKLRNERSEDSLIAAPLAAALAMERVFGIDDHTADAGYSDPKAADQAIRNAWNNAASSKRTEMDEHLNTKLADVGGVMALYRALNAKSQAGLAYESDFGAALEESSPQQFGRVYVGYWETRNLRMAANIREVIGSMPGNRMLVIVGASHKPYLDAYLNQMHGVRIVPVDQVLR